MAALSSAENMAPADEMIRTLLEVPAGLRVERGQHRPGERVADDGDGVGPLALDGVPQLGGVEAAAGEEHDRAAGGQGREGADADPGAVHQRRGRYRDDPLVERGDRGGHLVDRDRLHADQRGHGHEQAVERGADARPRRPWACRWSRRCRSWRRRRGCARSAPPARPRRSRPRSAGPGGRAPGRSRRRHRPRSAGPAGPPRPRRRPRHRRGRRGRSSASASAFSRRYPTSCGGVAPVDVERHRPQLDGREVALEVLGAVVQQQPDLGAGGRRRRPARTAASRADRSSNSRQLIRRSPWTTAARSPSASLSASHSVAGWTSMPAEPPESIIRGTLPSAPRGCSRDRFEGARPVTWRGRQGGAHSVQIPHSFPCVNGTCPFTARTRLENGCSLRCVTTDEVHALRARKGVAVMAQRHERIRIGGRS